MRSIRLLICTVLITLPMEAQPPGDLGQGPGQQPPRLVILPTENQALALAVVDLLSLPIDDRLYTRYLWIPSGSFNHVRASSLTVNYLNRGTLIARPMPLGKDKLILQRINLRHYAATYEDLQELVEAWEEFQFDPRFNLLLTKDTIEFNFTDVKHTLKKKFVSKWEDVAVDVAPYVHTDGKTYTKKWEKRETKVEVADNSDVIRQVSPHLDLNLVAILVEGTHSQAPVVSLPYFLFRSLSTVQDDGVFKTIYGGLYYRLRGIKKAKKGTDEDNLFEQIQIGSVRDGIKARDVFDKQHSDGRVAVFQSGVTGRPRRTDMLRSLNGHVNFNTSFLSITRDLKRKSIDIGTHPLLNLIDFKEDASELIFEGNTGLHVFALFDGAGNLLDQATDDVAIDSTIPSPYGSVLQSAISCIRCHAKAGGWQRLENDVAKLTNNFLDVFDDFGFKGKKLSVHGREYTRQEVIQRLAGLYSGDPETLALPRARDDYARAILRATGPWPGTNQLNIVQTACNEISNIYADYWYRKVTATDALQDLGVIGEWKDDTEAGKKLKELLPPIIDPIIGIAVEDPRIGALMAGLGIVRSDYDLVFSFMATRYARSKK